MLAVYLGGAECGQEGGEGSEKPIAWDPFRCRGAGSGRGPGAAGSSPALLRVPHIPGIVTFWVSIVTPPTTTAQG